MQTTRLVRILLLTLAINYGSSLTVDTRERCEPEPGEIGICTFVEQCPNAIEIIRNRGHPKLCGFEGKTPIICCSLKPIVSTTTESYGALAKQKCEEHKIASITTTTTTPRLSTIQTRTRRRIQLVSDTNDKPLELPHMALLGYGPESDMRWLCGGSLISENFILTAAHCLNSKYGPVQRVSLGASYFFDYQDKSLQTFGVKNVIAHPDYSSRQDYHDIALIELDRDANIQSGVKPACLHTDSVISKNTLETTGWGETELYGDNSDFMVKMDLKFVPHDNCSSFYDAPRKLSKGLDEKSQFCAIGEERSAAICQGDSGGSLQFPKDPDDPLFTIVGITSLGIKCSLVPAVYTRVSNYVPWIESIVWKN